MADQLIKDNGNIITINDPNNVNVWHSGEGEDRVNQINGAPPYEDMHIFAELTAVNKARTILVSGGDGTKYHVEDNGMNDTLRVNFMGNDQNLESDDRNNPNYLNFTTNYYDGSTGSNMNYESFGMSSIHVIINSSFIPQVNIQFIDVRGLSFFNQENSPYRILFDFPPPIFNLTIKGYYGKTLSYRLHLVKYTSEFKSENGNFVIDAQFVAMTYAPLTDILFRYVINFPLMVQKERTGDPSTSVRPTNTNDLIIKLKNLYSAVSDLLKTDKDALEYDKSLVKLERNTELLGLVHNYSNELTNKNGKPYLLKKTLINSGYFSNDYELTPISFTDYNTLINEQGTDAEPSQMDDKLIIAYVVTPNDDGKNEATLSATTKTYTDALLEYKTSLLSRATDLGDPNQFSEANIYNPQTFTNNYNPTTQKTEPNVLTKYAYIDVTTFYMKLYKDRQDIQNKLTELTEILNVTINKMVLQKLGMTPTIYNIFKVILDDVDVFFDIIRNTSTEAEKNHHPTYKDLIINSAQYADIKISDSDSKNQIYAFPLVIDKKKMCGGFTEERVAPLVLSNSLPEPFPELTLVDDFINTFFTQKNRAYLANMLAEQSSDGSHIWIPISPIDSVLSSTDIASPYTGIDNTDGGSQFQPINDKSDVRLNQVLSIMLKRYYILTQAIIPNSFYSNTQTALRDSYIKLYSSSEANNLAISITEKKYGDNIQAIARSWSTDPTAFYDYLEANLNIWYDFTEEQQKFFPVSGNDPSVGINAYVDKTNPNYVGLEINDKVIYERKGKEVSDNPIDIFQEAQKTGIIQQILSSNTPEFFFSFTQENVLYLKDIKVKNLRKTRKEDAGEHIGSTQVDTRFLASRGTIKTRKPTTPETSDIVLLGTTVGSVLGSKKYKIPAINELLDNGNAGFWGSPTTDAKRLNAFENVVDTWVDELSDNDDAISASTIFSNSKLTALIYMSNFGWTQGVHNRYFQKLNELIFDNPSVIDVPKFLPFYMGALVDAERNGWLNDIKEYFTGTAQGGQLLRSSGLYIFADYHDINTLMATKDKDVLQSYFLDFYNENFNTLRDNMVRLFDEVQTEVANGTKKKKAYETLLSNKYFNATVGVFLGRTSIINYGQHTFNRETDNKIGYQSLKSLNEEPKVGRQLSPKEINDKYFKAFFTSLASAIVDKQNVEKNEREASNKLKGDEDIMTQTYYSFKNINDKWLSTPVRTNPKGYPFNEPNKNLIDSFVFVDRAMNPAGNTIINPEILIDLFDDHNVSVFGVLTQLLSSNGFNFFPIQNFMTHSRESWIDSFKVSTNTEVDYSPSFVCMYIGGGSSYPTGIRNGFVDDGIIDITTTNALDFKTKKECEDADKEADNQEENNTAKEAFRNVRAFRVKFGEQNQSMFKDISIESKEYPETNESIEILSRISGDNKLQAPIPKGQNLYNLYENRAYKATVTGLGNAMIQPTQYFQLDNIPMFNGAYLILNVEHNIVPNKMTTKFSGTKILQFPIPRVLDSAALFGFGGGESHRTKASEMSAADAVTGAVAINMSPGRLEELDSVYGIDVSHHQGTIDWNQVTTNHNDPEYPEVKFAIIKSTEGRTYNDPLTKKHADGAKSVGIKITYYHYAYQYSGNDPVTNATEQANQFLGSLTSLPTPDFPLVLDMEDYSHDGVVRKWSVVKTNNDTWINTFINVLKDADYDTILYGGKYWFEGNTSDDFGDIPLWHAQYPNDPEMSNPNIANGWKNWTAWQFSDFGKVTGVKSPKLDVNAMRKRYFDSYNA